MSNNCHSGRMDAMTTPPTPTDPFSPAGLGPLQLRNRFIKSATFEGLTRDNVASDRLVEFHRQIAAGGVAMTTVAYCAVSPEGSTDGRTLLLTRGGGAGPRPTGRGRPRRGRTGFGADRARRRGGECGGHRTAQHRPDPHPQPLGMRRTLAASEAEIQRITEAFADGARHVADAGFDAVEVHLGHGYLLSAFLSPGAQHPHRPVGREPREPGTLPATGPGGRPRGRRRPRWP